MEVNQPSSHNVSEISAPLAGRSQRGRFSMLARSLLSSNETSHSTMSPNSVRGIMNPFRTQLGLPPLEVSRSTSRSSKSPDLNQNNSSPLVVATQDTPPQSVYVSTESNPVKTNKSPLDNDNNSDSDPVVAESLMHQLSNMSLEAIPENKNNNPPMGIAAVVPLQPLRTLTHNYSIYTTPVASKSKQAPLCPPPPAGIPFYSNTKPRSQSMRSAKKPNSGWRFANEVVGGKEYLLIDQLGKGGCGEVHLVIEKQSRKRFALKKVNLSGLDDRGVEECVNEVKLLVELKDTDLVIQIESWEMNAGERTMKIIMEVGQCDLNRSIVVDKIYSLIELKFIWERILCIVQAIHGKGIVHADLKPANFVWIGKKLKIIDFGIANKLQTDYTSIATANPKGTLNFISPETVTQDAFGRTKISPKSDIWSLGCILHFMVFGQTPFQNITNQWGKINAITKGVLSYPPLPPKFQDSSLLSVLQCCFKLDPRQRPTATELLSHPFLTGKN